jgi:serine/threonine protein kinase
VDFIDKYDNGSWRIQELIGNGSFGKVYKIYKEEFGLKSTAALKVISVPSSVEEISYLRSEGLNEADINNILNAQVAKVLKEIKFVEEFRGNTNIVGCDDYKVMPKEGEIGYYILMRMELLFSLDKVLEWTNFGEADAAKAGIDICAALVLLAKNKTIHRDIKPANIMVSKHGDYKLADFGIAREIEGITSAMTRTGTTVFMAPEVFYGKGYGASADLYSLGLVLYKIMNNGRMPFFPVYPAGINLNDREKAFERRITGEQLPPPANASKGMSAIILKACAYDRVQRYQNASEMKSDLENLIKPMNQKKSSAQPAAPQAQPQPQVKLQQQQPKPTEQVMINGLLYSTSTDALNITTFSLKQEDIQGISKLSNLVALNIEYEKDMIRDYNAFSYRSPLNLKPLSKLQNLVNISISKLNIDDLKPLSGLQNLAKLNLRFNYISDLSPLSGLHNLTNLNLSNNNLTDVSPLSGLHNLETLHLISNSIKDIKPLAGLKKIKSFSLSCRKLNSIEALFNMKGLTELYLSGFSGIEIKNIDTYLLTHLHLDNCYDISPYYLCGCSGLKELSLSHNGIVNLKGLEIMRNLSKLILRGNFIKDLTPLSRLNNLTELDLYGNDIKNFSPLYGIQNLKTLNVSSISGWEEKQLKRKLPQLTITHAITNDFRI